MNSGWEFDWDHKHDSLPGLAWLSASNEQDTSKDLVRFTHGHCWWWINQLDMDHELFSRICDLDFRYCYDSDIMLLADWLYKAVSYFRNEAMFITTDVTIVSFKHLVAHRTIRWYRSTTPRIF